MIKWITAAMLTASLAWGQLEFDGADQYVGVPSVSQYDIRDVSATPFTVAMWVYPETSPADASGLFAIGTVNYQAFNLLMNDDETLWLLGDTNGSAAWEINQYSTGALTLNAWNHVALTRTTSGLYTFWIDGQSAGAFTLATDLYLNTYSLRFGSHYAGAGAYYLDGIMSAPWMEHVSLTSNEVAYAAWQDCLRYGRGDMHTNATLMAIMERWDTEPANTNCVLALDFEHTGVADGLVVSNSVTIRDRSGNGNDGTPYNEPTKETP